MRKAKDCRFLIDGIKGKTVMWKTPETKRRPFKAQQKSTKYKVIRFKESIHGSNDRCKSVEIELYLGVGQAHGEKLCKIDFFGVIGIALIHQGFRLALSHCIPHDEASSVGA